MTALTGRRQPQAARLAVAAVFFANGALFANVIPRYPEIRNDLGLSNAGLGSALAAFPLGALVAGVFAAALIQRFGSARVATVGIVGLAGALVLVGLAPSWAVLAAILFVAGGIDAVTDVGQNAHGLRVQRAYGRSIVNSFHGIWSIGAVFGGLMGAADDRTRRVARGRARRGIALLRGRRARELTTSSSEDRDDTERAQRPRSKVSRSTLRALAALGVLAACGAVVEDAGASWARST